jgi:hypothetical protein
MRPRRSWHGRIEEIEIKELCRYVGFKKEMREQKRSEEKGGLESDIQRLSLRRYGYAQFKSLQETKDAIERKEVEWWGRGSWELHAFKGYELL